MLSGKDAPLGTEKMPPAELHQCAGLCFTSVKKAGVGVTLELGSGFVLAKLPGKGGRQSWGWSAPLFVSLASGGLGLTLGFSSIQVGRPGQLGGGPAVSVRLTEAACTLKRSSAWRKPRGCHREPMLPSALTSLLGAST